MNRAPRIRILIVDDEAAQMTALCDTLGAQDFDPVGCGSGAAGLLALQQQGPFELLLSDLMMPGMDGIMLMRQALQLDANLAVIIMTGAGTIDSAVEAMRAGAMDYILKPFRLSTAMPVLERSLRLRQLRLHNETLARQLSERMTELEIANVELDAFTRSASHDLRTPLNAVIGFSGLVLARYGGQLPEQAADWLRQIEAAGQRMNELIDDLLRLSQLGRQALRLAPVDLNVLLRRVVAAQQPLAAAVEIIVAVDLPPVMADEGLLEQVFVNLLSNACKFSHGAARPRVEIGIEQCDGRPVLFVRDNGAGFEMAQAHRLFVPFERLHKAEEFAGTGVGLSIVQRIVQRHGGRIWAVGKRGEGATFYLELPWLLASPITRP
ncbi:MAG: ATP-binding protein [Burkholderiaceae bacterium]